MSFKDTLNKFACKTNEFAERLNKVAEENKRLDMKYQTSSYENELRNRKNNGEKISKEEIDRLNRMKQKVKSMDEAKKQSKSEPSKNAANRYRRTDADFERNSVGQDKSPHSFSHKTGVSLEQACKIAPNETGVYIIYLNGRIMKCGRAAYDQGIRWRFVQYYNLNYDDRARKGDCWSISQNNRDDVTVSWQACPVSKCKELEYKLFDKYGKGDWAKRAPSNCSEDSWPLLI